MNTKPGGISPTDFVTAFSERLSAEAAKDSAVGKLRAKDKAMEKLGADLKVLAWVRQVRKMEPADAEAFVGKFFRYCRWLNMEVGTQPSLFAAADDFGKPTDKAILVLTEAVAFEEGQKAGKAGRDARDNRFEAGSPMYAKFYEGWVEGQKILAMQLGEERPADGSTLRKKSKKDVEQREAAPKPGRRGRARKALDEAREHLGT